MCKTSCDVVVVGAGPNGLTAAIVLATAGLSVVVIEGQSRLGGSCRTEALTLPGFAHDVCSAIHPMGALSPVFSRLPLNQHGLSWVTAPLPLAHPLDGGRVVSLHRLIEDTAAALPGDDGAAWQRLLGPFVRRHDPLFREILQPIRVPQHPWLLARFGRLALQSADALVRHFKEEETRALFGGCAAHSFLSLAAPASASFGLALAIAAHAVDWPCARGGSQAIVDALAAHARSLGCTIVEGQPIRSMADVPETRAVLFDVTPRQLERVAGTHFTAGYRRRLRQFRYGPGAFKIDYALSAPIPWRTADCRRAATVHVGGTYADIARAEHEAATGRLPERPFVLVAQQSVFDDSRAPAGQHTGWAYCHVPHGCDVDVTDRIEAQIERFAPGFRDTILQRHVLPPAALEAHNPNLVGGDIAGGANTLSQFLLRPFPRWDPYTTSNPMLYMCSSSTPPGGGVHGMCGYWAARSALRHSFGKDVPATLSLAVPPLMSPNR